MVIDRRALLPALIGLLALPVLAEQVDASVVHVGDRWQLRTLDGFTQEVTLQFSHRVVDVNAREIIVELQNANAAGRALRYYDRNWNGLDLGNTTFDPYYPMFQFPLSVGASWKKSYRTTTTRGEAYTATLSATVTALEKVSVPAGEFEAYRIESDVDAAGTGADVATTTGHAITWYAASVAHYVRREVTTFSSGRVRSRMIDELVAFEPASGRSPGVK